MNHKQARSAVHALALSLAAVVAGVIAGCARVSGPTVTDGSGHAWSITVSQPRFAGDERCDDDPAIDIAVMTADLPSSGYGITLHEEATEDDARRIAACFRDALTSGDLTISRPGQQ